MRGSFGEATPSGLFQSLSMASVNGAKGLVLFLRPLIIFCLKNGINAVGLQSVCLQDGVLMDQTDENSLGLSLLQKGETMAVKPSFIGRRQITIQNIECSHWTSHVNERTPSSTQETDRELSQQAVAVRRNPKLSRTD
ncbi:hypothetical protein AVEN_141987-1 [Araneus ventricosus]|uniref:Uncharacterized protein n=1 Tax=Araneus ventricosus TaxID=182803 RepID=A0A4Y2KE37_ARAVE|nr:hypothetical protein AVEN_141987-1 [Araneus ventricosus]